MQTTRFALLSSLVLLLGHGTAVAQTPPAEPMAATAETSTAAVSTAAASTAAAPTPEPAAMGAAPEGPAVEPVAVAPVAAAPAAEETFPAAWFRIDSDGGSLQLWAGATHPLSSTVGLATDMYVLATALSTGFVSLGELDVGPAITAGAFTLTPMLGVQADWGNHRLAALVPQFYLTGGPDPIYTELWLQNYAYTVFDKSNTTVAGGGNSIYARWFLDYKLGKYAGIGPEVELTYALNHFSKNAVSGKSLASLPVGVNLMLPNYGKGNTFLLFAGYETAKTATARDSRFAGRLTFVRNF